MPMKDANQYLCLSRVTKHTEVDAVLVSLELRVPLTAIPLSAELHIALPHQFLTTASVPFDANFYPYAPGHFPRHTVLAHVSLGEPVVKQSKVTDNLGPQCSIRSPKVPKANIRRKDQTRKRTDRPFKEVGLRHVL